MTEQEFIDNVKRCHAIVLFSDVSDFTQLAEMCDPEEVADILSQIRRAAERVVSDHDGVINQFYGDGILAIFGFQDPGENDIQKATDAALALHQAIEELSFGHYFTTPFKIRLHSGIHAGLIVAQEGDFVQGRFKLYGDALNTAARLSDAADNNQIFASASTLRGVLPYYKTQKIAPLNLKGKLEPIDAYRVLGRSGVTTRFEASQFRGLTPFVGREKQLKQCSDYFASVLQGNFKLVTVVGDAGLGKTRFVEQWIQGLPDNGYKILRGFCESNVRGVPLQPFVQILQQFLGIDSTSPADEVEQKLHTNLSNLDRNLVLHLNELHHLLTFSIDGIRGQTSSLTAAQTWVNLLIDLFISLAEKQPVIIFIDDWHWGDENSRLLILKLTQLPINHSIFVLLATRNIEQDDPAKNGVVLPLTPFSLDTSRQAVFELFPAEYDVGIAEKIHERSGGNVLFIEELCLSLMNVKKIRSSEKALFNIPATLHGLIEARVKQLPTQFATLVRAASILGRVFSQQLLEQIQGYALTADVIAELAFYDLVYAVETEGTLRFKHGITRDVIYNSVALKTRQSLHKRAAAILEEKPNYRSSLEQLEALAYHYSCAAENEKAVPFAEQAGDKALAVSSLDCARHHYLLALTMLRNATQTADVMQHWITLSMRWAIACTYKPSRENVEILEHAENCAIDTQNHHGLAQVKYSLGWIHYVLGESLRSIKCLEQGLVMAEEVGDVKLAAQIQMTLGQSHAAAGNYDEALDYLDRAIAIKKSFPSSKNPPIGSAYGLANKALVLADRGDFKSAHECIDEALESIRGANHVIEGSILAVLGVILLWQGRWGKAIEVANRHKLVAEQFSATQSFAIGCVVENYAKWMHYGDEKLIEKLTQTVDWLIENDFYMYASLFLAWLADGLLAQGNFLAARRYALDALDRAQARDFTGEAMAYRTLAAIALQSEPDLANGMESAEYYLEEAVRAANYRQSAHDQAVNCFHRAKLFVQRDQTSDAQAALDTAQRGFAQMDMQWHLAESRKLIAQE